MTNILDRVARISSSAQYGQFRPATPREFFAMRLAQKLNDGAAIRAGHRDLEGLCLALADWSAELRLLLASK
jgi:hypothetical protein